MGNEPELDRLEKLLTEGQLPKEAKQTGTRLLNRINSPVRVAIFGLPGSGKSSLLNFLAGQKIIPDGLSLPTLELSWGAHAKTSLTLQDGSTNECDGISLEGAAKQNPAFVKIELPLPILEKITLLEIVSDGSTDDLTASLDWATRRAEIALWTTQEFSDAEQALWSRVPDVLKGHSFLVLTKADILSSDDALSDKLAALKPIVSEEFRSLFPIATVQAVAATLADGTADQIAANESGGKALLKALLWQVEAGRRADLDSVLIFLNRHTAKKRQLSKRPVSKISPISTNSRQLPSIEAPVEDSAREIGSELRDLWTNALKYLNERGSDLSQIVAQNGTQDVTAILLHCADTADHLTETFNDEVTIEPDFAHLHEDILDSAEMILLFHMENGEGPAADAVTILLQLRRGLEEKLAA